MSVDRGSVWSLALGFGRPRRRHQLLLAYILPFLLVIAAVAYGVGKEFRKASAVFDRIEASIRKAGAANVDAALVRSVAGNGDRIEIEIFDMHTGALIATNARQNAFEPGTLNVGFLRTIHPFRTPWRIRQTTRTPWREVLRGEETILWIAIILLPVIWF